MATQRYKSNKDALVAEIVGLSDTPAGNRTRSIIRPREANAMGRTVEAYRRALRLQFSRREIQEIIAEGRKRVWPRLNNEAVKLVSPERFVRHWSALGIDFRLAELPWREGLLLLGFYVGKVQRSIAKPVICVNTAHHPALVGITFDHEMGHYLTRQIFASARDEPFSLNTGFAEHIHDGAELAADILVSLGIYPLRIAAELFSSSNQAPYDASHNLTQGLPSAVQMYLDINYLRSNLNLRGEKKKQCKAGIAHYTILREALLAEFDL